MHMFFSAKTLCSRLVEECITSFSLHCNSSNTTLFLMYRTFIIYISTSSGVIRDIVMFLFIKSAYRIFLFIFLIRFSFFAGLVGFIRGISFSLAVKHYFLAFGMLHFDSVGSLVSHIACSTNTFVFNFTGLNSAEFFKI